MYFAQVTCPKVICQPPADEVFDVTTLFNKEDKSGSRLPESDIILWEKYPAERRRLLDIISAHDI
ncbi:MAG: hypothetical protein WA941_19630 [Nitrososphaeraceae archaeon]